MAQMQFMQDGRRRPSAVRDFNVPPGQRQKARKIWTPLSGLLPPNGPDGKYQVRCFVDTMGFSLDDRDLPTLTTAVMTERGLEAQICCLLDHFYPRGSGSGSGSGNDQEALWSQLFNAPFTDPDGRVVQYFLVKLDHCVSEYYGRPTQWFAPFVAIVQSSGWGKSRVIKEMASHRLIVFYFSLMAQSSSGYPKADKQIAERLCSVKTKRDAYAIFHACLSWLVEQDQGFDAAQFFEQQQTLQWPEELKRRICNSEACEAETMQQDFGAFWKKSEPRTGASILFVLDEARQLLQLQKQPNEEAGDTAFTLLRRACRDFTWKQRARSGALLVVIDTLGKVSNLSPRSDSDPSGRVAAGGLALLSPISAIPTFNLIQEANDRNNNSLEAISNQVRFLSRGRPLWHASLKSEAETVEDETKVRNLLRLAVVKLLGGKSFQELRKHSISSLVVLGRLIAVDVCPQDKSVEELVASHMHVCLYISESREFMLTLVPPEPVLAEAARTLLFSPGVMQQQLRHLNTCMLQGLVSAGERGELVGRLLLLHNMDELNRDISEPEYLKNFLVKLTKSQWAGFDASSQHLNEAKVFFNAFYPYFGKRVTCEVLQQYLRNAGAMICKQGQWGYDLYIPIVLGNHDLNDPANVSYVAVQIKNRKDFLNSLHIIELMSNEASRIVSSDDGVAPCLFISMQLGSNESESKFSQTTSRQGVLGIALDGLSAINYPAEWQESLLVLLRERPDPKSIIRSYAAQEVDVDAANSIMQDLQNRAE